MRARVTPRAEPGGPADPLTAVAARLVALAEADGAREVCGLVVARSGRAEGAPVSGRLEVWPMPNGAADPARGYLIPPEALLRAMTRLDEEGLGLVAVYHSHPRGGANLSTSDLEVALAGGEPVLPGVAQIVVALEEGRAVRVRAHRFLDGRFDGADLWSATR